MQRPRLETKEARAEFNAILKRIGFKGEVSYVYRLYDADDGLLYVGSTNNLRTRLRTHYQEKEWFQDVARLDVRIFSDRRRAYAAEDHAIKTELPRHNVYLRA